ncbi:MAG: hypothetical protein LBC18_02790 [Opitutaceae bacterium]|jgi:hypothetical protein|nr:hypothetical protein [Opitutaceae bacterium]
MNLMPNSPGDTTPAPCYFQYYLIFNKQVMTMLRGGVHFLSHSPSSFFFSLSLSLSPGPHLTKEERRN